MFGQILLYNSKKFKEISIYCNYISNHLLSPLRKMPCNIKSQLQKIINNKHILDLTARKFLIELLEVNRLSNHHYIYSDVYLIYLLTP